MGEGNGFMIHTVIWLSVLGVALLLPNALAIRFALLGIGDAPVQVSAPASAPVVAARPKVQRSTPQLFRFGYLWKALSPIILGVTVILGMGLGGTVGYALMGLGLLNVIFGFLGWDGYIPGQKR